MSPTDGSGSLLAHNKEFSALLVADRPRWVYDRKARQLQSRFENIRVDIGYVCPTDGFCYWEDLCREKRYDVIWFLGFRMGHDDVHQNPDSLAYFVAQQNAQGTAVVASVTNSLIHMRLPDSISNGSALDFSLQLTSSERDLQSECFDRTFSTSEGGGCRRISLVCGYLTPSR